MAERTVNVNIKYNVDAAGLDRLSAAANRAQQATNNLNKNSQQATKQTAEGYKFAARSIETMELELQRLRQQIKLTAVADTTRLSKLRADYRSALQQLQALKKEYLEIDKVNKQIAQSTGNVANQFNQLFTTVKLILTAGIVREVVDMGLSMSKLAGNVEGVDRAFRRAFPNAEVLLSGLRQSTRGTITDFVLMQRTLQATNLGVSVEHLGTLFEFAAARAQQTGESVDYLVDSIVRGIGRKSVLVLDNLGLSTTRLKEEFNGASIASQSVAEVTKGVANIARVELEKMGGYSETAATKVDKLAVSWEELRVTVAKKFEDGGLVDFLNSYVEAFQSLLEANNRGITIEELLADRERKRIAIMETQLFLQRNLTGEREKDIPFLEETIQKTQKDILTRNNLIASQKQMLENMIKEREERSVASQAFDREGQIEIEFRQKVIDELVKEMAHRQEWLKIYLGQLAALEKGNDARERELGIIEKLEADIESISEKIKQATVQGTIFDGEGNLVSATAGSIADLNRQLEIMQGRLADLKKSGLPEFTSPEVFEKVSKVIEEEFQKNAENVTNEFINISNVITRIDAQLRGLKDAIPVPASTTPTTFLDQLLTELDEAENVLKGVGIDILSDQIKANTDLQVESLRVQLDEIRNFYDEQMLLAGDNERAKDELRLQEERRTRAMQIRIAKQEKEARKFSIIIDTAAGIVKAFATMPTPAAIVQSAIIAALGSSQLAIVNRQPVPKFKEGGLITGKGTGTSDSIPIMASNREYMVNADSTSKSFRLLEAINAKKIDDRILSDIRGIPGGNVRVVQMDPKPIIEAINKQKYPDLVREGSQIWEARKVGDNYKRYVRSKSMSK